MIETLQANLSSVQQRIDEAAKRSGRTADDVELIAVTKYVDSETTAALVAAGCTTLGESRPQLLWEKAEALGNLDVQWHLIGHLQRNKAKRTLDVVQLIHSVDSLRLLKEINKLSAASQSSTHVLLEINVSDEPAKHGFTADQLPNVAEEVGSLEHIKVSGLMCMAGLGSSALETRREFASLRELRDSISDLPDNVDLHELSMGMSGDFETAIEEGSTMVRIGSLLFEGVPR